MTSEPDQSDSRCNCPPMRDVFREGVGTKPPCPVHPEPDLSDKIAPRPEIVVNGEIVGHGAEGMLVALTKMVPALDAAASDQERE